MASKKISQLAELTAAADEDLLAIVDDPSGAPETKKITVGNLLAPVAASYSSNAGQSIPNQSITVVNYEDMDDDPGNLVTIGESWKFTAPVAGRYAVSAQVLFDASTAWAETERAILYLYRNGVQFRTLGFQHASAAASVYLCVSGSTYVTLEAGETIDIRVWQNSGSALLLAAANTYNHVAIWKI
jgi:hypothetical protein